MKSRYPQAASAAPEFEALSQRVDHLEDASGATYERVVWRHTLAHKTQSLYALGLSDEKDEFPSLHGIHIGDPDFWFEKLVEEHDRAAKAWVIEIIPVEGDHLMADPEHANCGSSGSSGESRILVTIRDILREGEDFEYVRELTSEDLPEDEDEEGGYIDYGYGDEDDDEDYE